MQVYFCQNKEESKCMKRSEKPTGSNRGIFLSWLVKSDDDELDQSVKSRGSLKSM